MRPKVVCFVLLLGPSVFLLAEETFQNDSVKTKIYQGFSGGMMLHTGYLYGVNSAAPADETGWSYSPQGVTMGIGGALRVHLWKRFRVGFEGYMSTLYTDLSDQNKHLKAGSYLRIGCGGINADAYWRKGRTWPYIGASLGGGNIRSLYIVDGNQRDWAHEQEAYVNKQTFFYITPYLGCDYCITQKLHLTLRIDWMMAIHRSKLIAPNGPRLYLGIMFTH